MFNIGEIVIIASTETTKIWSRGSAKYPFQKKKEKKNEKIHSMIISQLLYAFCRS